MATADAAAVMQVVVDRAKGGDLDACSLILARLWPRPRGRMVSLDMPRIASASDIPKALTGVLSAVAQGRITVEEASGLTIVIEATRRGIEICELDQRMRNIERRLNATAEGSD
jgi:hypothetical protein